MSGKERQRAPRIHSPTDAVQFTANGAETTNHNQAALTGGGGSSGSGGGVHIAVVMTSDSTSIVVVLTRLGRQYRCYRCCSDQRGSRYFCCCNHGRVGIVISVLLVTSCSVGNVVVTSSLGVMAIVIWRHNAVKTAVFSLALYSPFLFIGTLVSLSCALM